MSYCVLFPLFQFTPSSRQETAEAGTPGLLLPALLLSCFYRCAHSGFFLGSSVSTTLFLHINLSQTQIHMLSFHILLSVPGSTVININYNFLWCTKSMICIEGYLCVNRWIPLISRGSIIPDFLICVVFFFFSKECLTIYNEIKKGSIINIKNCLCAQWFTFKPGIFKK